MAPDATGALRLRRRLARSAASNLTGRIAALVISFLLTPFILQHLGPRDFGLWVVAGSVVGYGYLLDLGIAGAVTKYVAEHRARGEHHEAQAIVATALSVYTALGVLVVCLAAVGAPIFPSLFGLEDEQRATATSLFLLMGLSLGISIPATINTAVLHGLQRFDVLSVITTASAFVSAALTVAVLTLGGGLLGMVALNIPVALATQFAAALAIRRLAPQLPLGWARPRRSVVRKISSYSLATFATNVTERISTRSDEIIIAAFLPLSSVTPYALARRLSELTRMLAEQFLKLLPALASELDATGDADRLRRLYLAGTRLTLVLFLPVAAALCVMAAPVLTIWVGAEYAVGAPVVVVLTVAGLISSSQWPAGLILQGMARHRPLAVMNVGTALANVVLSVALVRPFGVLGVALGTLLPTALVCFVVVMPYAMRVLGAGIADVWRQVLFPSLAPVVPLLAVLIAGTALLTPTTLIDLLLVTFAAFLAYGTTYLLFGALPEERALFRHLVRRLTSPPAIASPPR